jgi:hypothetical protein
MKNEQEIEFMEVPESKSKNESLRDIFAWLIVVGLAFSGGALLVYYAQKQKTAIVPSDKVYLDSISNAEQHKEIIREMRELIAEIKADCGCEGTKKVGQKESVKPAAQTPSRTQPASKAVVEDSVSVEPSAVVETETAKEAVEEVENSKGSCFGVVSYAKSSWER